VHFSVWNRVLAALSIILLTLLVASSQSAPSRAVVVRNPKLPQHDWSTYGGAPENDHYSPLAQINRSNVTKLAVAWSFDTGEPGGLQTSPLEVEGVLYGITPSQKIFALDGTNGKPLWKFDSGIRGTQPDRGLAYWTDGKDKRVIVGVMNFVYALDAATGTPIASFGKNGRIDLRDDLGRDPATLSIYLTSPAVIYKDLLIVGGREPETLPAPPGDIRAYDVRTGKLRWSFHTIPRPGEYGYDTWPKDAWKTSGSANNWSGMSLDAKRGIVYVPTGSAAMDFYGADRLGDNLFADCVLALNAETGERIWHFQEVKHDIWDRDLPAPPVLLTLKRDGKKVDAVAQTTKQGVVYVFDRANGKPLFPIEYKKFPPSDVPGEVASSDQPFPTKPAPFARQSVTEADLTTRTAEAHTWALDRFHQFRGGSQFIPFSVRQDPLVVPGFDGGAEWGGSAADRETGFLYVNANEMAWTGGLQQNTGAGSVESIYLNQCGVCHGEKMEGSPPTIPSLVGAGDRYTPMELTTIIKNGRGRMQGFANFTEEQLFALVNYISTGERKELTSSGSAASPLQYRFTGYHKFLDPDGYPAIRPPWGTLTAIDLNSGEHVWRVPLGEYPELAAVGQTNTGTENYGGPVVTAGGLVFIGATNYDKKFRVFDKSNGKLLWETKLPFSGNATPITYQVDGRQYVVIAAGGGKDPKSGSGGVYVAFALGKRD